MTQKILRNFTLTIAVLTLLLTLYSFFNPRFFTAVSLLIPLVVLLTLVVTHWDDPETHQANSVGRHLRLTFAVAYKHCTKTEWLILLLALISLVMKIGGLFF